MNVFTNFTLKELIISFNKNNFTFITGFGMIVDFNTSYYVLDTETIFLLNDNYAYVTQKKFSLPFYLVNTNSSLYITGDENMWKTDKYLNVLKTHTKYASYRDIYLNSTENFIYVASEAYTYFQAFDLNLVLKNTVSISPSNPRSFSE